MLKTRVQYILTMIISFVLTVFLDSYLMLIVFASLVLLPVCSFLLLLLTRNQIELIAEIPLAQNLTPEILLTLVNRSLFPAPAVEWNLVLENRLNGNQTSQSLRSVVRGRSTRTIRLSLHKPRTGKITVTTSSAIVTDFLGLFFFSLPMPAPQQIYIYPEILDIGLKGFNRRESDGNPINYSPNKTGSDVHEIFALHEYAEGDDLRRIHWKLSSKTDILMVRDFGLPLSSQIALLLELTTKGLVTDGEDISFSVDILATLSTSLAEMGVVHNIAWYDRAYEDFHVAQIAEFADFYTVLPALLESRASDDGSRALREYILRGESDTDALLYYITADPDLGLIGQGTSAQTMRTIIVETGDNHRPLDYWPMELDMIKITPATHSGVVL